MSMDSSPNPKPLSALVVVEGEHPETEFFELFGERMGLNLKLHAVKCNVYTLFKWMTEECSTEDLTSDDLVLDVPRLIAQHESNESVRNLLLQHYDALYLVYDCDLHDSRVSDKDNPPSVDSRARANLLELEQMVRVLNDEYSTTVGKLYLNYPMFESCLDADSFCDPSFKTRNVALDKLLNDGYKHRVKGRLMHYAFQNRSNWTREDFYDLIRMNVCKAGYLLGVSDIDRNPERFYEALSQDAILLEQRKSITAGSGMAVLNTSVFIPVDQFGEKYPKFYQQIMSSREYPVIRDSKQLSETNESADFVMFTNPGLSLCDLLIGELKGMVQVFRDVDVIVFPDNFCRVLPDYHNLLVNYDMSKVAARNAAVLRAKRSSAMNWCCRNTILNTGVKTMTEVIQNARTVIFVNDFCK